MKPTQLVIVAAALALPVALAEGGCSSSSGGTGNPTGTGSPTGTSTSTGVSPSTSVASSGAGGATVGSTVTSAGVGGGGGSGGSGGAGGGGTCTAKTTVTGVPAYTSVTHQSACSMADVAAFIAACDSSTATNTTCTTWFNTAANAMCGDCIQPADDAVTGATIYDDQTGMYANTPGCVQLTDGNATCAGPLYELQICHDDACDSVACMNASDTDYTACIKSAETGACSSQVTAAAACMADTVDGGALAANGPCSSDTEVTYVICGNGQ